MIRLFSRNTAIGIAVMAIFLLAGCSDDQAETVTDTPAPARPAAIQTISGSAIGSMSFNGVVRSAERAELAFRVPGRLSAMDVDEGDKVEEGQVLARLEQKEFLRSVNSAKVEFDKAQADYERGVQIFESTQAIAKSDLEKLKTQRDLARNKLSNARQDLDNTALRAPFTGVIAKKSVSNFRNVNSGQAIYVLHDLNNLEVVIDVPSKMFLAPNGQRNAFAVVENESDVRLPVTYKTFSSDADALSQTYRVALEFSDLEGQNVLPGMNARVYPVNDATMSGTIVRVPVRAVLPTNTGSEFVWLVGESGAVEKRIVEVGQLLEDQVIVKDGLEVGDQVVVAGVNALTEGMKVRPLQDKGQP